MNKHEPTQMECDNADDDLNRIISAKEELTDWLDSLNRILEMAPKNFFAANGDEFAVFSSMIEEGFDDILHHEWHRLKEISQSAAYPAQIPTCETLRVQMLQRRRDAKAARMRNNKMPAISTHLNLAGENHD